MDELKALVEEGKAYYVQLSQQRDQEAQEKHEQSIKDAKEAWDNLTGYVRSIVPEVLHPYINKWDVHSPEARPTRDMRAEIVVPSWRPIWVNVGQTAREYAEGGPWHLMTICVPWAGEECCIPEYDREYFFHGPDDFGFAEGDGPFYLDTRNKQTFSQDEWHKVCAWAQHHGTLQAKREEEIKEKNTAAWAAYRERQAEKERIQAETAAAKADPGGPSPVLPWHRMKVAHDTLFTVQALEKGEAASAAALVAIAHMLYAYLEWVHNDICKEPRNFGDGPPFL